ncbi:MAG: hypothetical protein AAB590_02875 [Patescibacteria group bacterium]
MAGLSLFMLIPDEIGICGNSTSCGVWENIGAWVFVIFLCVFYLSSLVFLVCDKKSRLPYLILTILVIVAGVLTFIDLEKSSGGFSPFTSDGEIAVIFFLTIHSGYSFLYILRRFLYRYDWYVRMPRSLVVMISIVLPVSILILVSAWL